MSMAWSAAAMAVSVAGSMAASSSAANSQMKSASNNSRDYNMSLEKQYLHSIVRNSYKTGLLNVQLGLQKKKAAQEGYDQTVQARAAMGNASAQAAATGSVGASVDAVQNDIDMKLGEAQAVSADNYEQLLDNYNAELAMGKINATSEVLSSDPMKVSYEGPSTGQMFGGALLQGAASFIGGYARNQMQLGLGAAPKVASNSGVITGAFGGSMTGLGGLR